MFSKLVIILLIIAIPVSVYLIGQRTGFFGKASISDIPKQVQITNISDNSFTVSWITDKETSGFISFGDSEKLGNTALDDRDTGAEQARFTHYVTIKSLDPEKVYFFKINSTDKSYQQKTAPVTSDAPPVAQVIFGSVITKDGKIPKEAIIYLNFEDSTALSTFTRNGNYLLTLNNARVKDLSTYISYKGGDKVKVYGVSPEGSYEITSIVSSNKPIPTFKLLNP